jgi:phosphatidylserine/phosphatidylglycerophosphate/cardiolipin synthase-like enzyme
MSKLADEIRSAAMHLPEGQLASLASLLSGCVSPSAAWKVAAGFPQAVVRDKANDVVKAWASEAPDLPGRAISLALTAAAATGAGVRNASSIEPVWTGPATAEIAVRQTRAALLEVINLAKKRVILVSFAAYKVPQLLTALQEAHARGVEIRLVLETTEDSGGALTIGAGEAFASVKGIAQFWAWPLERRPGGAKLHAKAAMADETAAMVASANLTGAALDDNIELGLLVRGGPVPQKLARHFMALMDHGDLVRRLA